MAGATVRVAFYKGHPCPLQLCVLSRHFGVVFGVVLTTF